MTIDLSRPLRIHVVGVGGAGMSAIASVLARMGHQVTGSDLKSSRPLERLRAEGLDARVGHDPALVHGVDALAISTAVPERNLEVVEARRLDIPVLSRAEVLAAITSLRRSVAVAGTHGKTTTSSMLALVLVEAGIRPSFIIGGDVNDIGTNAVWDEGEWAVVEADESDGTFLRLVPELAVVTSVEPDHLDHYGTLAALEGAFGRFMGAADRVVVAADDPVAAFLAPPGAVSFGTTPGARFLLSDIELGRSEASFSMHDGRRDLGIFRIAVPGEHNARNAAAAVAAATTIGVEADVARQALARFAGVARRYEFRGERNGVTFVDDYAHLPSEVRAALATARRGGFRRVVAVFQPHRFSRTAALAADFADAFGDADVLVVTAVYPAGEAPRPGVTGQLVVDAVKAAHPELDATYIPTHEELLWHLGSLLQEGDCCITLEAGDLVGLPDELLASESW